MNREDDMPLLEEAARRGIRYLRQSRERGVAPADDAVAALERFREPLSEQGDRPADVLAMLDTLGSPATMATTSPRFFGFVIGGALPVTVATNWLTTAWDQNVAMHAVTPAAAILETVSAEWMIDLFGLPRESGYAFVSGATVANFTALAAARNRVYADIGWNVEADGLIAAPPVTVVVGAEAHPTVTKALGLLGFGRNRVVCVPVDGQGRMDVAQLPDIAGPTIVCTQAGNINTGAFDPIREPGIVRHVQPLVRIGGPGVGPVDPSRELRHFWRGRGPEPEGAVDMDPGAMRLRAIANLVDWV